MEKFHGNVKCRCGFTQKYHNSETCKKFLPNKRFLMKKNLTLQQKTQLNLFYDN